jgi:hypothetical protein
MINCPRCKKEIDVAIEFCPYCGLELPFYKAWNPTEVVFPDLPKKARLEGHIEYCNKTISTNNKIIREIPLMFLIMLIIIGFPAFYIWKGLLWLMLPVCLFLIYLFFSKRSINSELEPQLKTYKNQLNNLK